MAKCLSKAINSPDIPGILFEGIHWKVSKKNKITDSKLNVGHKGTMCKWEKNEHLDQMIFL